MIIEVQNVQVERSSPRAAKTKRVIVYRCDQCQKVYEGKYQARYLTNRRFHLCSRECVGESRALGGVAVVHMLAARDMVRWQTALSTTVQQRYGVKNASSLAWVKQQKAATTRAHYGVDNPQQHPEIKRRTIETHAKHGRNWMSRPEKAFRLLLEQRFGAGNVRVQQLLQRWSVDFYVECERTYVQFDGVYWHGLDRPLEQLIASTSVRDRAIYGKWLKDRALDAYVLKNGLRLVRITDVMFKADPQACVKAVERVT